MTIAEALKRQGQSVSIEGTVTTKPGLLDTSDERVTIQDSSAAILLKLPAKASASVGQRVRVTGAIGTYYGAPQITANALVNLGQGSVSATAVSSAPIPAALEWRVVSVTGTVASVARDGASWHVELTVSGGTIPITGLDRSGIASTELQTGRQATVTGVVKRAYPTSTDQRLSVVPRSAADIKLSAGSPSPRPSPSLSPRPIGSGPIVTGKPSFGVSGAGPGGFDPGGGIGGPGQTLGAADGPAVIAISAMTEHVGERIRIGGTVRGITTDVVTVDDGTGQAAVRLAGESATLADQLQPGDLVNVSGTVGRTAAGGIELVVTTSADVVSMALPASNSATTSADASSFGEAGVVGDSSSEPVQPDGDSRAPVIAIVLLLGLVSTTLFAFALAGRDRRARARAAANKLIEQVRQRLARARTALNNG